jgi:murein DD-endopeptidase MepM/ murein hydrolase activator NlpD
VARGALALLALLVLAPALASGAKFDVNSAFARGHEVAAHVVKNEPGPIWPLFGAPMREMLKDSANFAQVLTSIARATGRFDSLLDENALEEKGAFTYRAECRFAKSPEPWTVSISFDDDGRIIGLFVRPTAGREDKPYASPHLDYVPRTALRLPFRGEWTVAWGGREIAQNDHARFRDQRFALDLLMTREGRTHEGDGTNLADYFCYGQPVLAPAAGTVAWLQDSLPDNRPGRADRQHPAGNCVMLDLGHGEYALIAHLQPRTLRVRKGDRVAADAEIGRCGNSGNTSEPHVHFHLQDGPKFGDADGLPVRFVDLFVDGVHADTAEIVRGQKVRRP